jgi:putative DNA primase/helicase
VTTNPEVLMLEAMAAVGLAPKDGVIFDGKIHAFHVHGDKSGSKNGRYQGHPDYPAAGWFGTHRIGEWHRFCVRRAAYSARSAGLWNRGRPATNDGPYLVRKQVKAYGIRALRDVLLIPVRDAEGMLWSLQFISPDGTKRFLTGGKKRGCYFGIGRPAGVLCVCEGYATGASIHEATGHATAIAFDAGNLEPVARALRAKFPALRLVLCADNDMATPGNPGLTMATAAARAVGGYLAVPRFEEVQA